jgi:hypothetical protein
MCGYGVASRAMAFYPNRESFENVNISVAFDGRTVFRQIAYPVYYLMYGEMGYELSSLDGSCVWRNALGCTDSSCLVSSSI